MLIGQGVADFELPDQGGTTWRLGRLLADGPLALFFLQSARTSSCVRTASLFRDVGAEFDAAGLQRAGISPDPEGRLRRFATRHALDYPLLGDVDAAVAAMFGVQRSRLSRWLGLAVHRCTFVIDTDRRVLAVITGEFNLSRHAEGALAAVGRN